METTGFMSLSKKLDDLLDKAAPGDTVDVQHEGGRAVVDVVDVGRLGVRVKRVKVSRNRDVPIEQIAGELPERLRGLPEKVQPVEVDPGLGGGTFRTPVHKRDGDYYQVDVRGRDSEVEHYEVDDNGRRTRKDFTVTRDSLGRIVDDLS